MTVFLVFSVLMFLVVMALAIYALSCADLSEHRRKDAQAARNHWYETARGAEQRLAALHLDLARLSQSELAARLRLARLMGRYQYLIVSNGPAGLLVDDRWHALDSKQRSYWLRRGSKLIEDGADEKTARAVLACKPDPKNEDKTA